MSHLSPFITFPESIDQEYWDALTPLAKAIPELVLDTRRRLFIPVDWLVPAQSQMIWVDGMVDIRARDTTPFIAASAATHMVCRWVHVCAGDDPSLTSRIVPLRTERVHPCRQNDPRNAFPPIPVIHQRLPRVIVYVNFFKDVFGALRSHLCALCHWTMCIMNIPAHLREHIVRVQSLAVVPTDVCMCDINGRMVPLLLDLQHGMVMDLPSGPAYVRMGVYSHTAVRTVLTSQRTICIVLCV